MFPLHRPDLPTSTGTLAESIEGSLRSFVEKPGTIVTVSGGPLPAIDELAIDLSGARIAAAPARPRPVVEGSSRAFRAASVRVNGEDIDVFGASTNLSMDATDVEIHERRDTSGNVLLTLNSARRGDLRFDISKAGLEGLIKTFAQREATKHGVTLDAVGIDWASRPPRGVDATVSVRARKFFMSAAVKLSGSLVIDDNLSAQLSALKCRGDGALAGIACGMLTPHLERLNGQSFSLRALPIGELAVRDLQIAASDKLEVRATFGSPA